MQEGETTKRGVLCTLEHIRSWPKADGRTLLVLPSENSGADTHLLLQRDRRSDDCHGQKASSLDVKRCPTLGAETTHDLNTTNLGSARFAQNGRKRHSPLLPPASVGHPLQIAAR
ncbi:hypothetical protein SDC9_56080 [bioreactor metagenome]|uniref:Uncharacterized protein n=1 Tax=bioreactor metagenome TaxID=1076179 RepID=A0A644X1D4_9ZZZZ